MRRSIAVIAAAVAFAAGGIVLVSCTDTNIKTEDSALPYETKVDFAETTVVTEPPEPPLVLLEEAKEYMAKNPDYAGRCWIPGVFDEIIVQSEDNDYYLNHSFEKKETQAGTVFADYRDILDTRKRSDNVVLYGHNQKDGTMFGNLDYYKWNKNYFKSQPLIYYNTPYNERVYKIVSVFLINAMPEDDNGNVWNYHDQINLRDEGKFNDFVSQFTKRSLIKTGVDVQYGDKFITLSTCSTEFDNSRLVIIGREVREGESTEVDMSKFEINDNPLYPAVWYKYNGGSYVEE